MNEELTVAAAVIAVDLMRRSQPEGELDSEVIALAFARAHQSVEDGMKKVHKERAQRSPASVQPLRA